MATNDALDKLIAQIPTAKPRELEIIEGRLKVLGIAQQLEANE